MASMSRITTGLRDVDCQSGDMDTIIGDKSNEG